MSLSGGKLTLDGTEPGIVDIMGDGWVSVALLPASVIRHNILITKQLIKQSINKQGE